MPTAAGNEGLSREVGTRTILVDYCMFDQGILASGRLTTETRSEAPIDTLARAPSANEDSKSRLHLPLLGHLQNPALWLTAV